MKKIKRWFNCVFLRKHTFDYYTDKCIICGKDINEISSKEGSA